MRTFCDNTGRTWTIRLDIPGMRRVRDKLGLHLGQMKLIEVLQGPMADPILGCDVLWLLVEPQAAAAGVDSESFGASLVGGAIDEAYEALLYSMVDWQPAGELRQRTQDLVEALLEDLRAGQAANAAARAAVAAALRNASSGEAVGA